MTSKITTAETGTTGAAVTSGQNVGGDVIDLISKSAGGSITIDATAGRQHNGSKSLRFTTSATADTAILGFNFADSQATVAVQFYFRFDALPAAANTICQIRNASSGVASIIIDATGKPRASYTGGQGALSTVALTPGTVYRFGLTVNLGATGTGDSSVTYAFYVGDSTTAQHTTTSTGLSLGTGTIASCRIGKTSGSETTTIAANYDDFRATTGTATLLGPESANSAPTANAGPDQTGLEPAATVTLDGSGSSDSDGTIASYTWVQTAGSPTVTLAGTGATRTFTAPLTLAGTTLTFGLTVTDNLGASSTQDTMTVTVLPAAERIAIGGVWVPARISIL